MLGITLSFRSKAMALMCAIALSALLVDYSGNTPLLDHVNEKNQTDAVVYKQGFLRVAGDDDNKTRESNENKLVSGDDDKEDLQAPPPTATNHKIQFPENEPPKNLHIAMIGDSVSRFQYMALVFYLHYGRHITEEDRPARLSFKDKELSPQPGDTHHNFSKVILRPYEECDCYRPTAWLPHVFVDNRYYYDPIRNNSVTFLLKYGAMPVHGHWMPGEEHQPHNLSYVEEDFVWEGNWSYAIRYLSQLQPRPKYVIFNAGHHPNHMYDPAEQLDIVEAFQQTGLVGVYKFTTYKNVHILPRHVGHEHKMCQLMNYRCIDYSWTQNVSGSLYYDHVHLMPGPNQRMNEELLDVLKTIEEEEEEEDVR